MLFCALCAQEYCQDCDSHMGPAARAARKHVCSSCSAKRYRADADTAGQQPAVAVAASLSVTTQQRGADEQKSSAESHHSERVSTATHTLPRAPPRTRTSARHRCSFVAVLLLLNRAPVCAAGALQQLQCPPYGWAAATAQAPLPRLRREQRRCHNASRRSSPRSSASAACGSRSPAVPALAGGSPHHRSARCCCHARAARLDTAGSG